MKKVDCAGQSVSMADMTEQTDFQYNTIRQLMNGRSPIIPAATSIQKQGFATARQKCQPIPFCSMGSAGSRCTVGHGMNKQSYNHGGTLDDKDKLSDNNS